MVGTKVRLLVSLTAMAVFTGVIGFAAQGKPESMRLRKVGDVVHRSGPTIEDAHVPDARACGVVGPCFEYELQVPPSHAGVALRVAVTMVLADPGGVRPWADFTVKSPEMLFEVQLYAPGMDPTGEPLQSGENGYDDDGLHGYSRELKVGGLDSDGLPLPPPTAGPWNIRVVPKSISGMALRLRGALHDETDAPTGPQLPDLRLNPPFELTFGTPTATAGPGAVSPHDGPHPSCMSEELAEAVQSGFDLPQLCLRFTMGLENIGSGTLDLVWQRPAAEEEAAGQVGGATMRPQRQRACDFFGRECVYLPDRGIETLFHWGHAHEHWVDAWSIELIAVPGANWKPSTTRGLPPGPMARKLGINPYPELIADWDRVWSLSRTPVAADDSGCFADDGGGCSGAFPIRLEAGYADLYEWNRGGNYVEMPQGSVPLSPAPGWYVLKATADPLDLVAESDEDNNDSYALFEVATDGSIELHQRGYGSDPWSGRKSDLRDSP